MPPARAEHAGRDASSVGGDEEQHAVVGEVPPALAEHAERIADVLDDIHQEENVEAAPLELRVRPTPVSTRAPCRSCATVARLRLGSTPIAARP